MHKTFLALITLLLTNAAATEDPKEPTVFEKSTFRVQLRNLLEHQQLLPHNIDAIVRSFSDTLTMAFDCSPNSKVDRVELSVTTRQISWDPNLVIDGKPVKMPPNVIGYYVWYPLIRIEGRKKTIRANNLIMVNFDEVGHKKQLLNTMSKQALLFHELLHGQLLLDAMAQQSWQEDNCDCNFDFTAYDQEHEIIPKLTHAFLANLAEREQYVFAVNILPENAFPYAFSVLVTNDDFLQKNDRWQTVHFFPEGSNVARESFQVQVRGDKVMATGRLINRRKPGFAIIIFEPEN